MQHPQHHLHLSTAAGRVNDEPTDKAASKAKSQERPMSKAPHARMLRFTLTKTWMTEYSPYRVYHGSVSPASASVRQHHVASQDEGKRQETLVSLLSAAAQYPLPFQQGGNQTAAADRTPQHKVQAEERWSRWSTSSTSALTLMDCDGFKTREETQNVHRFDETFRNVQPTSG